MRLRLLWCGPQERCITQVTTEEEAITWKAKDKDSSSLGLGLRAK